MRPTEDELDSHMRSFRARLREDGFKCTPQRLEIYRALVAGDREAHPGVEEIMDWVKDRLAGLSPDTVYRTLSTLEGIGLVRRVAGAVERARFDPNMDWHGHFCCARCGAIRDVACPPPESASAGLPDLTGYGRITEWQWTWRGVCRGCDAAPLPPQPAPTA